MTHNLGGPVVDAHFVFGIYLGGVITPSLIGSANMKSWAFVLDSSSMKCGWVRRKGLERVR